MKIEAIPNYAEIEVVGISKSVADERINGSVERNKFTGRRILTLKEGFDPASNDANAPANMIARGDGTRRIQTVAKHDTFAVKIALGDGFKSRELLLKNVLVCKDTKDNKGATLVYIKWDDDENSQVLGKIEEFAPRMLAAHPNAFGDWMLIGNDDNRVFVYSYSDVDPETGKGVPQD
jgi:hypothetical protein